MKTLAIDAIPEDVRQTLLQVSLTDPHVRLAVRMLYDAEVDQAPAILARALVSLSRAAQGLSAQLVEAVSNQQPVIHMALPADWGDPWRKR